MNNLPCVVGHGDSLALLVLVNLVTATLASEVKPHSFQNPNPSLAVTFGSLGISHGYL